MSKHIEATEAALEALTQALQRNDSDMTKAAAEALDALTRKAAVENHGPMVEAA